MQTMPSIPHRPVSIGRQLRDSVHVEGLAICFYETAGLCDRLSNDAPEWSKLSHSQQNTYRSIMIAAMTSLEAAQRYEAQLRAREAVAASHYGRDYSRLPPPLQRKVKFIVQTAVQTYNGVLEGYYEPLQPVRAVELEPAKDEAAS